jgi:UDP-glucose 4-epimerase
MKNTFVIGGAGFIGQHLVRHLIERGFRVTIYDNFSSGRREWLPRDATTRVGHVQDYDRLRSVMAEDEYDIVFHLAANPDIARAATEPTIDFCQGTVLTKNVLEAMRETGASRLVYFSGSGVYGEPAHDREVFSESSPTCAPISTYGASKLASETMISAYCSMFGMVARSFRFANVVGPRQTHGVGFDFLRKLSEDRTRLQILGDGNQTKSYIHVDDVIAAVMTVMEGARAGYDVFNVSTPDTLTVTQIAEMACMVMSVNLNAMRFDYTGGTRGWKGDVPVVRLACDKIRALDWRPAMNSKDAMWTALLAMRLEAEAGKK